MFPVLAVLLSATSPPLMIERCGDVVIAAGQVRTGSAIRLIARCGGAVRVEGTLRLPRGGSLEVEGGIIAISGRLQAAGARVTLRGRGPVRLSGELHAASLDEEGQSLAVSGVIDVGHLRANNLDHAIIFSGDTVLSGDVSDPGDIEIDPGVTVTLGAGTALLSLVADSDHDGAGAFVMLGSARLDANGRPLQIVASGSSQVGTLTNVKDLTFESLVTAGQPTVLLVDPLTASGALILLGQTFSPAGNPLDLGALTVFGGTFLGDSEDVIVRGAVTVISGRLRAPSGVLTVLGPWLQQGGRFDANGGTVNFAGAAGIQAINFGIDPFATVTHDGGSTLDFRPAWPGRQRIDVDRRRVADGGLLSFPVPVRLVGPHPVFTQAQASGADLAFTDAWRNRLPHELERFVTTPGQEELVAWVNVATLWSDHDSPIYLHWGNGLTDAQSDVAGTWDSLYVGVYHLGEASDAGVAVDSSQAHRDGTISGARPAAAGEIGTGFDFTGSTRVVLPPYSNLDGRLTVEAWVNPNAQMGTGGGNRILDADWSVPGGLLLFTWEGTSVSLLAATDAGWFGPGGAHTFVLGQWVHVSATFAPEGSESYINGAFAGDAGAPAASYFYDPTPLCLSSHAFSDPWEGQLDEVRLSNAVRSAGYLFTSYALSAAPPTAATDAGANPYDLPLGASCGASTVVCRNAPCEDGWCCLAPCGVCERCTASGFCQPVLSAPDPDSCASCDALGVCQTALPDAGAPDAGRADAGPVDAGALDGGATAGHFAAGCGCSGGAGAPLLGLWLLAARRSRRARQSS